MLSVETKRGAKVCSRIFGAGRTLGTRVLAIASLRGALTLAMLAATLLVAAHPAQAQTEKVLYNFTGTSDGSFPTSSLTLNNGNLYGTTSTGGLGFGTVFELSPNGTGGWTQTTLYSFCPVAGCADGENPTYSNVIIDGAGNLYGTAFGGGGNGKGCVFELSPSGSSWTEQVIYNINSTHSGLTLGPLGSTGNVIYGTSFGTIFELTPDGLGGWTPTV